MGSVTDDEEIRQLCEERRFDEATARLLHRYGPEILGLLVALHRDHDEAGDVFSSFAEKVWTSIARFEWRSSVRTWAYVLARRASYDAQRSAKREARRVRPLSDSPAAEQMEARVRTATLTLLRTETKSALARLRETLPAEDQMLLVLRIDRKLSWSDLAVVLLENDAPGPEDLKREAARLRKRFQLVKDRLRLLATERGLIPA
jgi:RNA polymerase sigma-70 factor (ECF subfamily)